MKQWQSAPLGFSARTLTLIAIATISLLSLVAIAGYRHAQADGLLAALTALVACCFGIGAARLLRVLSQGPQTATYLAILGMLLRMGAPLMVCMIVALQGGQLLQLGFAYYLLVLFPLTLTIDTLWSIAQANPRVG